jgi:SAM-dependent methyltransferase
MKLCSNCDKAFDRRSWKCPYCFFAAERVPGVELFQMDARRFPFLEEFDLIGAFDMLEHVKEDEEVLSQMYQATRKGGGILLTVPHHPFLWSASDYLARHERPAAIRRGS